ncbi:hypothetical protein [Cupriavidus oxalaticus]|uniref:Conjugal transfer protein n=1 Tax=Cupriavidus oxalaticus TaxID=96344 RepID=A0A4P7LPZ9_9BURK|nr:hypothetical protein [Cupriavidus oxalaticus]QBY54461.1 hypothetical protein E0W60_26060 [Cupriavidus oxalaticus]
MPSLLFRSVLVLLLAVFSAPSMAADMQGSCMVSFNIKNKTFINGVTPVSCQALESRRLALFQQVNAMPTTGNVDVSGALQKLDSLQAKLKASNASSDWAGISMAITGNAMATYALGVCVLGDVPDCAIAVVSKLMSMVSLVDSAASASDKSKAVQQMTTDIANLRKAIEALQPPAAAIRNRMVDDFNGMCANIKTHCLN